ncbi:MAG: RNase P subunit p30 family protein [Candidatus Nanoarchaeia archaeon]
MAYFDLLMPQGNEVELAREALKLGITPIFLYPFKDRKEINKKREELKKALGDFLFYIGIYVRPKSAGDIKRVAKLWLEADFLVAIMPRELVRIAVSSPRFDAIFRVPELFGRDAPEYRHSNFNAVLANIASKNNVAYGVDFSYFLENSGYSLAKLMGREMQNIRLCRRKVPILIASMANEVWQLRLPENLSALGRVLGLNSPQAKASVSSAIRDILVRKEKRRSKAFVRPGVELVE